MDIAIQVALVAGAITILGTLVNFFSNLLAIWYSRKAKVDDWLFDRRVAELQNAIGRIGSLVGELEESIELVWKAYRPLIHSFDLRDVPPKVFKFFGSPEAYQEALKQSFIEASAEAYEGSEEATERIAEHLRGALRWANFQLPLLSIWFQEPEHNERRLKALFYQQSELYSELIGISNEITFWLQDNGQNFAELSGEPEKALEALEPRLKKVSNKQSSVSRECARLQRLLAADLTKSTKPFWQFFSESIVPNSKQKMGSSASNSDF